jgi:peptide/nickel transport system substrate-binding protein
VFATRLRTAAVLAALLAAGCSVTACSGSTPPAPDGGSKDGTALVLALPDQPSTLNPLLGHGAQGASPFYDGLVEPQPDRSLRPTLATDLPQPATDGKSWTVKLRAGVKFSDGTEFGAKDVVATYRALLDPAYGSPLRAAYSMLTGVTMVDQNTVRFDLSRPYPPFPNLLVLGIVPAASVAQPAPLTGNPLGTKPVGTGPYRLAEWKPGDKLTLHANPDYFDGPPKVTTVTVRFIADPKARADALHAGQVDGAELPPAAAKPFEKADGDVVYYHRTADYRAISLPSAGPVTGDRAVRQALNLAVDRAGLLAGQLGGHGSPAYTPIPPAMPEFVDPNATITLDRSAAGRQLDQAGWTAGADGVRARDGVPAKFTLVYPSDDAVDADLARAFAADAKTVGVQVTPEPVAPDALVQRAGQDAALIAGGTPADPDLTAYPVLHTPGEGGTLTNPGRYSDPQVDTALDAGRTLTDPAQRAAAYRQAQRVYLADPGLVFLAFPDHAYVLRDGWTGYQEVVEPHDHGLTWGPWWNLARWTPK